MRVPTDWRSAAAAPQPLRLQLRPELAAEIRRGIQSAVSTQLIEDVWSSSGALRSDRLVSEAVRRQRTMAVDVGFERGEKSSSPFLLYLPFL